MIKPGKSKNKSSVETLLQLSTHKKIPQKRECSLNRKLLNQVKRYDEMNQHGEE